MMPMYSIDEVAFYVFLKSEYSSLIFSEYGCNIPVSWRNNIKLKWDQISEEERNTFYKQAIVIKPIFEKYPYE